MSRKIGENHNIFTDTAVNLPPPKGGFAVGGNMDINELNDYERGEYDCILGYPALEGQSEAYELGYGKQYEKQETVGGQHEVK